MRLLNSVFLCSWGWMVLAWGHPSLPAHCLPVWPETAAAQGSGGGRGCCGDHELGCQVCSEVAETGHGGPAPVLSFIPPYSPQAPAWGD
jgi:hypothetical protein